jgi:hypothetical protein
MDHHEVMSQNRAALRATIGFTERQLGHLAWEPAVGSEATAELANAETRNDGSPWGENPPRTAYAAANLMMLGIVDDLKSLEQLLADQMPVIGPTVLARSAIEIASGAWWLMEPGIGVRRRVCRELVLSLTSARRVKQVADEYAEEYRKSGDPIPADVATMIAHGRQQELTVLQRIADLAIAAPTAGFSPEIGGEKADNATDATAEMFKALQPTGLPTNVPTTVFYRTYSAVTHGQFYGLTNFMTVAITPDGMPFWQWGPNFEILDSTIQIAIGAFREAYQRIAIVMGWAQEDFQSWEAEVDAIYNS